MAVLTVLLVAGGVWGAWSPQNRTAVFDALTDFSGRGGLPADQMEDQTRRATDGSPLPTPGVGESPNRLLPAVTPAVFSDADGFAFTTPSEDPLRPYGWSPCRPVHYVVDLTGAPAGFADSVRLVASEVSASTGLLFVDDGVVAEAVDLEREPFQPEVYGDRWAPVLIRFADAVAVPDFGGDIVGQAGPVGMTSAAGGATHFVSGAVYLDVELVDAPPWPGNLPAYLPVLRHEMGHLVGLDHVDDPTQIMFPTTGEPAAYQVGDLTGLSLVGQAECAPDL